jgi:hypothetical protein
VTTPPSTNITDSSVSDDEFGSRFLAYVDERIAYHEAELAKLAELRQLWAARHATEGTRSDNAS